MELKLYENTKTDGKFVTLKPDNSHYLIDSLKTPIGVVKCAAVRMTDTLMITANLCESFTVPKDLFSVD